MVSLDARTLVTQHNIWMLVDPEKNKPTKIQNVVNDTIKIYKISKFRMGTYTITCNIQPNEICSRSIGIVAATYFTLS